MKHFISTTLLLLALLLPATANANHESQPDWPDFKVDGIYYKVNNNHVEVSNFVTIYYYDGGELDYIEYLSDYSGDISIPETVTYNNVTYPVTAIASHAFNNCAITNIIIPNSITSIGSFAFSGCTGLTSLVIPNSVTSIGYSAFSECISLVNIDIPSSVTLIDNNAFDGTPWYNNQPDGLVYTGLVAYKYKGSMPDGTSIIIKDGTKAITYFAFQGCSGLNSIFIPNSVSVIGSYAFSSCNQISTLMVTGEGEWFGETINCTTSLFAVDSRITSVKGMKINPKENVSCYAANPPECDENSFTDYSATLHVPASSVAAYFTAPFWCNFTNIIGDAVAVTNLSLHQDSIEILAGDQMTLRATITPANAVPNTISWMTTDQSVATVENGVVTAIKGGECDIVATCLDKQAICHVLVNEILPEEIVLNQDNIKIEVGTQFTLTATVLPDNATDKTVTWMTTDQSVATVENGVITAIKGGECDIVATCQDKQAVCHVVVTEILPTEVTLNQDEAKIEIGSQLNLTATVQPENTSNPTVTWRTTNSAVATVSNGVVTGVGQGECNIIASCGDKQAICHVIVVEHLIYITLDQHSASLLPNHIITLTPTVSPVTTDLVVTSSNPAVAAARLAGDKIQVVGITEGHATIYVNSADGYAFSDSCLVEVYTERGDVNCDGFVNISDVTALIDVLLGGDVNHSEENADCNNDGKMTISDVTALIDALLGGAPLPEKNYEVITVNGVTFKMVKVQGGTFTMGATPDHGTEDPWNDEWPTHEVTVSSFSIGQTEVTQELWQAVMGSNPSYFTGDANRPVETVSWDECQQFIATLNQLTGMNFRLPTEAEWEYAARGGNMTEGYKYAGSNDINEIAWWDDNACDGVGESSPDYGTHPVAFKKANELGLYDMSGNVWEWCQDWYGPYSEEAQINPTGPETGTDHLHRGGSWINYARNCRVSCRFHWVPDNANYVGLRLVK